MGRRIKRPGANVKKAALVRFRRTAALVLAAAGLAAAGCGSKATGDERHTQAAQAPEAPRPTPDTTPIEALRTPAGLILKPGDASSAVTPVPSAPTPGASAKPAS
jgi:hypothetical protein